MENMENMNNMNNMNNIETTDYVEAIAPVAPTAPDIDENGISQDKVFRNIFVKNVATLEDGEEFIIDMESFKVEEEEVKMAYNYIVNAFKQFQQEKIFSDNMFVASYDGVKVVRKDIIKKIELVFDSQETA